MVHFKEYYMANYKWADGFKPAAMRKFEKGLADSDLDWGAGWIVLGIGFIPTLISALIFIFAFGIEIEIAFLISFLIFYFGIGIFLFWFQDEARCKAEYNEILEQEKQMNLFRDFGVDIP